MRNKFIKPIATAIVTCLLLVTPGTAWAEDTDLPVLVESSGVLSGTSLARNDTLTFSYRVTDDVGCCSFALWGIYSIPGNDTGSADIFYGSTSSPNRISGSATDGVYSYSLQIPSGVAYGTYYLKVQSIDLAGRYTHLVQIGTLTIAAPSVDSGGGTSPVAGPVSSPVTSPVAAQVPGILVSNYKKVVNQKSILKTLGIKKAKTDSIAYKVSSKSKKVCSATSTGVKPNKQGTCEVTVTKTSAKKRKTKYLLAIKFVK
jgi:hypothetical protein